MSPRIAKAIPPEVAALAFSAEVRNKLETEGGIALLSQPDWHKAQAHIRELCARISITNKLIDGYALNQSNTTRLELSRRDLIADAATRHGSLYRLLKK